MQSYPLDVIKVLNGRPITRQDILDSRRERNVRRLAYNRRSWGNKMKPCFIWVFDNGPVVPYGGWWLYVRIAKRYFQIDDDKLRFQIMELFPCGYLPMLENYGLWMPAFAANYHRYTKKRPTRQGMALARAVISPGGWLVGIEKLNRC